MLETKGDWRDVMGALVAGIGHDLNGHVTALKGVAHMARTGPWPDDELLDLFDEQVARLEEAVRLLRSLPLRRDEAPELSSLRDVIEPVVRLWRRRSGPRVARVESEAVSAVPVVLVRRRALTFALLLLLAEAEDFSNATSSIRVRYGADAEGAWIRIAGRPAGGPLELDGVAAIVEGSGGALEMGEWEGRTSFVVRLPLSA